MNRGIVLLLSLLAGSPALAAAPDRIALLFGSTDNVQLLQSADKVDACLLRHIEPTIRADGSVDQSSERYEESTFVALPPATAAALGNLLLSAATYDWSASEGGRRPQFYLRLRYTREAAVVTVDFCFLCQVLSLARDGRELGHANFGRNGDLFLTHFLKLFPHDEALHRVAREAGLPL